MATIGRNQAVTEFPSGLRFSGRIGWLMWLGLHLLYLLGGRNRVATLINLTWRYIAWGHGGTVIVGDEPTEPLHEGAGRPAVPGAADTTGAAAGRGQQEKSPAEQS